MTTQPEVETLSPWPCKLYKQLLRIALRRLLALGDGEGVQWIIDRMPPEEKP
jgi:hypothetical protein